MCAKLWQRKKARVEQATTAGPLSNVSAAKALADGLEDLVDDWRNDDPEYVEGCVLKLISKLNREYGTPKPDDDSPLSDTIKHLVTQPDATVVAHAREFEGFTSGYAEDPDWDDLESACYVLDGIVSELRRLIKVQTDAS